jgi:hypothetical protein
LIGDVVYVLPSFGGGNRIDVTDLGERAIAYANSDFPTIVHFLENRRHFHTGCNLSFIKKELMVIGIESSNGFETENVLYLEHLNVLLERLELELYAIEKNLTLFA